MQQSLSYVLVTPYTVAKSRTGGVLSRLLSRISLELVGAQMIAMDQKVTDDYADHPGAGLGWGCCYQRAPLHLYREQPGPLLWIGTPIAVVAL